MANFRPGPRSPAAGTSLGIFPLALSLCPNKYNRVTEVCSLSLLKITLVQVFCLTSSWFPIKNILHPAPYKGTLTHLLYPFQEPGFQERGLDEVQE